MNVRPYRAQRYVLRQDLQFEVLHEPSSIRHDVKRTSNAIRLRHISLAAAFGSTDPYRLVWLNTSQQPRARLCIAWN